MSRPALSAQRALEMVSLLASQPTRAFNLSEIAQATDTNLASCHAILQVLEAQGFLVRHPTHKTYRLGAAMAAMGEAAGAQDALLRNTRAAAAMIAERTGLESVLAARAGRDLIGLARYANSPLAPVSLRVGQRMPLRPPIGALFFAWAAEEDAEAWIAPEGADTPADLREIHVNALRLVRERGYMVTLRSQAQGMFTEMLNRAQTGVPDAGAMVSILQSFDNGLYQPQTVEDGTAYDAASVTAPILDAFGRVSFTLGLNLPAGPTDGREIKAYAFALSEICASAMQGDHGDSSQLRRAPG